MNDDSQELVDEISTSTETSEDDQEPVDEWVVEIEGRLETHAPRPSMDSDSSDSTNSSDREEYPSIFGKWQCWDDFGASFIPETQRWQFVACMSQWFGLNVKSYLKYMQHKVDLAWSYYQGVDELFRTAENNKHFIEHLLTNSCFLIFLMVYLTEEEYRKVLEDKMDDQTSFPKSATCKDFTKLLTFFDEDPVKYQLYMLTMNYQIPWFVLEAIYTELSNIGKLLDIPIHKLALPCFPKNPKVHMSKMDGGTVPKGGFKHLLHIFHWSRAPDGKYLVHATKLIRRFHIPSATDLLLSQTVFENNEGGSIDVSYSHNRRLSRVMQLTPLHLFQYSTKLYDSLLRFERWYLDCGMPFTAYVVCIACLVKTEVDARVLRENGVIPSTTFDDKEVLHCVQELKTFIPDGLLASNELVILEEEVMTHHKKSVYRVIGEFKKRYCSNTWIILSVIAGILLFALTFIQTIYGTLSYYKQ